MARIDLPQSQSRTRKRRKRVWVVLAAVVALAALAGGLIALARAPFLQITAVTVSGARADASGAIEALARERLADYYLYIFPKNNVFLYPREGISEALARAYPQFKSVDVHATDFHTVSVAVVERQPAAEFCPAHGVCYLMDEDGVIYAPESTSTPSFVSYVADAAVRALPQQFLTPERFRSLAALVGALSQSEPGDLVRKVAVDDDGDVLVYFQNGFLLLFDLADESGDVFERFGLALKSDPFKGRTLGDFEYLDLRFGDKLYYKLK